MMDDEIHRDNSERDRPESEPTGSDEHQLAGTPNQGGDGAQGNHDGETAVSVEDAADVVPDSPDLSIETSTEEIQSPALPYPIVGFGASAGGLQAFKEVLENLDPNTGMSFVLVTHMSPDQKSFLSEIIERYTNMPVSQIENGQRPEPNHVYVLLPNQSLTIREGRLRVEPPTRGERFPKTIDKFFHSLAADQKNHAIGVVLSGADGDGALGLKSIKGEGGIALVQSPESAEHGDMPRNSIAADHVDLVVPPGEIALELGRLAQQYTRPEVRFLGEGIVSPDDEHSYQKILQMLRSLSGLDLRLYKPETIRRRIARRMLLLRMDQLSQYQLFLQVRMDELRTLQEDVLINVTRFFRDPDFWDVLQTMVLPALTQDRPPERPIRIWSAGCSTGEEAYSLAITVMEYLSQHGMDTPVQVFGTDASEQSIETARTAVYPETLAAEISPDRLRRYFIKVDRGYQVSKRVRDTCIFARQNLANDPPFSHIDILSCRNVMIYFNQALQRQVMFTFHYALEPGGYMLLGMSEGLRDFGDIFSTVDRKHKIYMRTGNNLPHNFEPPRRFLNTQPAGITVRRSLTETESNVWPELELQRAADRIVLARFGPAGLIVDDRMNVLQSRGQTSDFLDITPGAVTWNLFRMLREGLVREVRSALQRAIHENVPATAIASLIDEQKGEQQIQIDILPIASASSRPRSFLVLFQPLAKADGPNLAERMLQPQLTVDEKDRLIAQLRQDLTSTRYHLQSLVEERDARNQELVSANEEIQSANEELQSTNEELETTKEELQSANEELQTVNDELQQRNNTLSQTSNDLTNLLNSVNIPLLMLSSDLRIRQFTPPMERLLNVRSSDVGRYISEIRLQLSIEDLKPLLIDVLETLATRELEVQDRDGRWHLMRIRPYRTAENKIDGLVILMLDIDQLRKSQQHMVDARDFAASVVESVPVPIVVLNQDSTIRTENTAFRTLTQSSTGLNGRSLPDLLGALWGVNGLREKLNELLESQPGTTIEFEHVSATNQRKVLLIRGRALFTDGSRVLLLTIEDITLQRTAEQVSTRHKMALETEIAVATRKLGRTQGELRGLNAHLFKAQEEERQRVARELHDDISQRLSLLEMLLHDVRLEDASTDNRTKIKSAQEQIESINTDVRQISHRLHPAILNDLGLSAALKALVTEFGERENMPATYVTQNLPDSWSPQTATSIYRITQEALRNVGKHAGKTHVKVVLAGEGDRLQLKVMDFGIGFDQEMDSQSPGLGMISMQERARLAGGTMNIASKLGEGTTVSVDIPVQQDD
jgi:two-component system CheB/CheR fusion protein